MAEKTLMQPTVSKLENGQALTGKTARDGTYYYTGNCQYDRDYRQFIVGHHYIKEDTFIRMIVDHVLFTRIAHGQDPVNDGKEFSLTDILDALRNRNCATDMLVVESAGTQWQNDSDIVIYPAEQKDQTKVYYSITLFTGLIELFSKENIEKFVFYKARKANGEPDIVFKVITSLGVRYYGDISGLP